MRRGTWTFGSVSEQREADLFWAELMGEPVTMRAAEQFGEDLPSWQRPRIGPATVRVFQGVPGRAMVLENRVRAAIVDAALTEEALWHHGSAPRFENNLAMFRNLVRYWLAENREVRPDVLVMLQNAIASGTSATTLTAEVARLNGVLTATAASTTVPASLVATALSRAQDSNLDTGAFSAWSAVWVSHCVRRAAITVGLEEFSGGVHHGRDGLLQPSFRHTDYVRVAHQRRAAGQHSTYHAFDPALVTIEPGDIIVQDRMDNGGFTFAQMPPANRNTHGDIVIAVNGDVAAEGNVVTLGGNLGFVDPATNTAVAHQESVRRRRYPLGTDGRLVIAADRLFTQEDNAGTLPPVPAAITATSPPHKRSTIRIFTVLKPVGTAMDVPERPPGAGVLA
jgi:hypothetical protein